MPGKEPLLTWTVGDVIDRATDVFGDTTAMVYTHQNISKTYTEYKKDVDQLAAGLVSLKLPVGSRVAILAPRLYEGAQLLYAAPKAGLTMIGIRLFGSVSELEFCLNKAECPALIIGDKFTEKDYYHMLLQTTPELENSAPGQLNSKRLPFMKHVITIGDTRKPGCITFDDLIYSATAEDYATMNSVSARVQFDQDAFIQYSSGTTGQPKPVRLSHFNVVNNANILGRFIGYHQQMHGGLRFNELILRYDAGNLKKEYTTFLRLKKIVHGCSETSPVITCTNPDEPTNRWIRTLGKPLDHVEVKVVDAEGRIVPWNSRGELCTRGPHVFKGYLNNEAITKDAIRDNWYHTGDEVTMSEDGRITFVGRIKEIINFKGFKVAPLEIESVLNTHPDVEEAQVIGVPDERTVEKVCAWIKLKSDNSLTQEDVTDFCKKKKLPEFKVPDFVLFVDSFPRTQTGKVQKNKMREQSVRIFNL